MNAAHRTTVTGVRFLLTLALWAALGLLLIAGTVFGARLFGRTWVLAHSADLVAIVIAETYVALLAAMLIVFGLRGVRDRLGFRFTSAGDVVLALGVWVLGLFVGAALTTALIPLLGEPQGNAEPLLRQSFDPLFVAIIVPTVCLLVPIAEELLFRGALFGWLRGHLPVPIAILLTAGIFAGAHLLPTLFPVLFVLGIGATWIREHTGSTFNSFVMHASQNTVAVAATYAVLVQQAHH